MVIPGLDPGTFRSRIITATRIRSVRRLPVARGGVRTSDRSPRGGAGAHRAPSFPPRPSVPDGTGPHPPSRWASMARQTATLALCSDRVRAKAWAAGPVGDEEEVSAALRVQGGADRILGRGGDGGRRQARDDVGVVRRLPAQLAGPQSTAQRALPAGDPVDHRRVGLQPHAFRQAVDEHAGHDPPLLGQAGLLLHDGRQDQRLLCGVPTGRPGARSAQAAARRRACASSIRATSAARSDPRDTS